MLVRSQDNEKITDKIEFLIAGIPEKGWGVYQSEKLFGEYSSLEKAIKALDMLEESYNRNGKVAYTPDGTLTTMICNLFQFPAEEELSDCEEELDSWGCEDCEKTF